MPCWFWDGTNWTPQHGAGPDGDNGVPVYDAAIQSVVELTFHLSRDTGMFEDKLWQWHGSN
jgi:hypothetical protein